MIGLIDADSILYVLGYNYREHMDEPSADIEIARAADDFVKTILTIVQADSYVGVFSPDKNFRHEVYKYAKYKGERPLKPDWFVRFAPIIKSRLIEKWGFFTVPDLEADDVICALAEYYGTKTIMEPTKINGKDANLLHNTEYIICSPDKDLRQIAGLHYDYKKEGASPCRVSSREASYNFWYSMLVGDVADNVKSLPGLGPKKVEALFKEREDEMMWGTIVMAQYVKYFGNYYGPLIYQETKDTLQLMSSRHRLWYNYRIVFDVMLDPSGPVPLKPFSHISEGSNPFFGTTQMIEDVLNEDLVEPFRMGLGASPEQREKQDWGTGQSKFIFGE